MKFHSLMAAALLFLSFDSAAAPVPPQGEPEATQAPAYRNGDLVLDLGDSLGAEVIRSSLAYFFRDSHIAIVNELPAGPVEAIEGQVDPALDAEPAPVTLPEPIPLALLGAGLALLGWTSRPGQRATRAACKWNPLQHLVPWPGLPWLD